MQAPARNLAREFDAVARAYDRLTALNPGYRRHLRASARRMGLGHGARILDLCCGTGLSTGALRRVYPDAEVTALDSSRRMLDVARAKPELSCVRWIHGDALAPAVAGIEGPFDGILMAYGLRNIGDRDTCLQRLRALLRPGGVLCVHEYTLSGSVRSRLVWESVSLAIIVPSGLVLGGTAGLFRYLQRSVRHFDRVHQLETRLRRAGFEGVRAVPMNGWQRGIVFTVLGRRPA